MFVTVDNGHNEIQGLEGSFRERHRTCLDSMPWFIDASDSISGSVLLDCRTYREPSEEHSSE